MKDFLELENYGLVLSKLYKEKLRVEHNIENFYKPCPDIANALIKDLGEFNEVIYLIESFGLKNIDIDKYNKFKQKYCKLELKKLDKKTIIKQK